MEGLKEKLRRQIAVSEEWDEPADGDSWRQEIGILITRNEAELFLKLLEESQ